MRAFFSALSLLTLFAMLTLVTQQSAMAASVPEYKLKAALIYNFVLFTDWPVESLAEGGKLVMCVNRDSPMRPAMMELADRLVRGHSIVIKLLADHDAIRNCHVQFLDSADRGRWPQMKKMLAGGNVLTIADQDESEYDGAIISLSLDNRRIVFAVDLNAARQAKIVLSSKLLRLAKSTQ